MEMKRIPILLLTGYLGSGKTTLVNHILSNKRGIKFAVIVNDLGEINIDAALIQKEGIVGQKDESLVSLQNGCICCTLQTELIDQVFNLMKMERFDYIVIEASGICEPEPIAQTLCSIPRLGGAYTQYGICYPDCIVSVVDALRMQDEFACGQKLARKDIEEDDIENLIIQQLEFCNIVLLNKASEVSTEELGRIRQIIHTLQPWAEIVECNYADINLERILYTNLFNYEQTATSAGWIRSIEKPVNETFETEHAQCQEHFHHEHHHHEHHHHEHHHHQEGEAAEYGIETFVYYRRQAFDLNKLDYFIMSKWPKNIIRAKGVCYFSNNRNMSYLFEQAGKQKVLSEAGQWYATMPKEELERLMLQEPGLVRDWDETYGDRMQKIVFIGQNIDKKQLSDDLDQCLE